MKFKCISLPDPSSGQSYKGEKKVVVPNQALSLQEILERFSRNEEVPVGKDASYDDGDDDLEKVAHMDLVDREEYVDKLVQIQNLHKAQERAKTKAAKEKAAAELKEELRVSIVKAAEKPPKAE